MRPSSVLLGAGLAVVLVAGCGRARAVRTEWSAMGTVAALQARGLHAERLLPVARKLAQERISAVEALLNAHDAASEISRLAPLPDEEVLARCDASVRPCYAAAFRLQKLSGGAFSPRWHGTNTLDLGAIAKGFAVDRAADAAYCGDNAGDTALLDLGGNLKSVRGRWKTGVLNPTGVGFAATVELREGEALATSAMYFRGAHIADGRTGEPVTNGVASVTVLSRSALWADGLSTTLFILGPDAGRTFLDTQLSALCGDLAVSVLWIMSDGAQHTYGDARFSRN